VAAAGEAELSRLAVSAQRRRQGIGRALAALCDERARSKGWPAIALWSRTGQVEAHRLYQSLGYARTPERDSVDASGQARVVFRLALQAVGAATR
jgi:ribosomal protein S18 acetylase RimI-like enzyme